MQRRGHPHSQAPKIIPKTPRNTTLKTTRKTTQKPESSCHMAPSKKKTALRHLKPPLPNLRHLPTRTHRNPQDHRQRSSTTTTTRMKGMADQMSSRQLSSPPLES
jgi:hypothetical protein